MSLRELRQRFREAIDAETHEIDAIFYMTLEHFCGIGKSAYILDPTKTLSHTQKRNILSALNQLKLDRPIQYILGYTYFFGLKVEVDHNVLIPRPETEELVHWVIQQVVHPKRILDVCTGSGCIAMALAYRFPEGCVEALDISEHALKLAAYNADMNNLNIDFSRVDILECSVLKKGFDVIISNPPYVLKSEKSRIHPNVLNYEPPMALFVEDKDPLVFYDKISRLAMVALSAEGQLFFEINEALGTEVVDLLKTIGYNRVDIEVDINGKDRMIRAKR